MTVQQDLYQLLSWEKWIDALLPSRCAACNEISNLKIICQVCESTIAFPKESVQTKTTSAFSYSTVIRKIIVEAKFKPDERKAHALVAYWSKQTTKEIILQTLNQKQFDAVSFVPIHWRRLLWRGFDLSAIFAKEISRKLKIPIVDLIVSKHFAKPLTLAKTTTERIQIAKRRFALRKLPMRKMEILLVDDITTTGATLDAVMHLIEKAGHQVSALTLAKTPDKIA